MGYRSEVAIKCEEKAYEKLMETCHNVNFMPDEIFKDEEDYILRWDWVKWYHDYYYVMAIERENDILVDCETPYINQALREYMDEEIKRITPLDNAIEIILK